MKHRITGVILAGGQSSRMQYRDKPLLAISGKTILAHVINHAIPQVDELLLSANRNLQAYNKYRLPVISDIPGLGDGPLAGIFCAMQWCQERSTPTDYVACFPGDVPYFPGNLVKTLRKEIIYKNALISWVKTNNQLQPLFSLWSLQLLENLRIALANGAYSPKRYIQSQSNALIHLQDNPEKYFFNINTPEDLEYAARFE